MAGFSTDNASVAIFVINRAGQFVYVNKKTYRDLEYSQDEILSLSIFDINLDFTTDNWSDYWNSLKKNRSLTFETRHKTKSGIVSPVELRCNFQNINDGEYNVVFAKDITIWKHTEESLWESQQKYEAISVVTCDWEFWISPAGIMLYVSPSSEHITGYRPDEFIDNPGLFTAITHPDDIETVRSHLQARLYRKNSPAHCNYRIIMRSGAVRWISHYCQPVYGGKGVYLGQWASNSAITDRKHKEGLPCKIEEYYKELIEDIPAFDIVFLPDGTLTYVNSTLCKAIGRSHEELLGTSFFNFLSCDRSDALLMRLLSLKPEHPLETHDETFQSPTGEVFWYQWTNRAFFNEKSEIIGFRAIGIDVTKRKLAEQVSKEESDYDFLTAPAQYTKFHQSITERKTAKELRRLSHRSETAKLQLEAILNNLVQSVILFDRNENLIWLNRAALVLHGFVQKQKLCVPREAFENLFDVWYLNGNLMQREDSPPYRALQGEIVRDCELRVMRRDTAKEWIGSYTAVPLTDSAGKVRQVIIIIYDITDKKQTEDLLKNKTLSLEEANIAIKIILKNRDEEKKEAEENIKQNIKTFIEPFLEKIKTLAVDKKQKTYINVVETNIKKIAYPLSTSLSFIDPPLTPTEQQIVHLVREGKSNKEIAESLNVSNRTVETHRRNIRRKIGINNKKTNLRTLLSSHR